MTSDEITALTDAQLIRKFMDTETALTLRNAKKGECSLSPLLKAELQARGLLPGGAEHGA